MRKLALLLAVAVALLTIPAMAGAVPPESWEDQFSEGPGYDPFFSEACGVDVDRVVDYSLKGRVFFDQQGAPVRETLRFVFTEVLQSEYSTVYTQAHRNFTWELFFNEEIGDYDVASVKATGNLEMSRLAGSGVFFKDSGIVGFDFFTEEEMRRGNVATEDQLAATCAALNPNYVGG